MKEFNKTQELRKIKFRQNKNTYIKRVSIILSCVILVIGVLYFTFAKFESNKSYTLIQGKLGDYSSGDLTIAVSINGISVDEFPENNGGFLLSNIECKDKNGDVEVDYDENTWKITGLQLTRKTKCTYYFIEKEEWTFDYNGSTGLDGSYQEFVVPKNGKYKIELWGSNGGYVSGDLDLTANKKFYLFVGAAGVNATSSNGAGYNGGGTSGYYGGSYGTGGSGATDIRYFDDVDPTSSDLLWNSTLGLRSRIMVAGAGSSNDAAGGGLSGYRSTYQYGTSYYNTHGASYGYPGNQTSGGQAPGVTCSGAQRGGVGSFGQGGAGGRSSSSAYSCGGNGGYYGGSGASGAASGGWSGGGGSSYISGHTGCVAITSASDQSPKSGCTTGTTDNNCSIHYSGLKFTNTKMIDGKGYPWTNVVATTYEKMPKPEGGYYDEGKGHTGNGYARITYLGE